MASLLMFYATLVLYSTTNALNLIVNTTNGAVEGSLSDDDGLVNKYLGIPYAKPPIGELRFAPPEPADPWDSTFTANKEASEIAACPQFEYPGYLAGAYPAVQSEDCLFINVYAPSDAIPMESNYTVMIYIHGGGYVFSYSNDPRYDPTNIVSYTGDVIVVTFNYRLGLLGALYDNMYDTGVEGNFNFMDQQLAIKWVHDNIAYFGGNPDNINIFGQSAGAGAVALHLLYNNDYITSGIMQSTYGLGTFRTPDTWFDAIYEFSVATECIDANSTVDDVNSTDLLSCWRSIPAINMVFAAFNPGLVTNWTFGFSPTVGTELLAEDPIFGLTDVTEEDIPPFIIGDNKDENFLFFGYNAVFSYDDLYTRIDAYFLDDDITQSILDVYGIDNETAGPGNEDNYGYAFTRFQDDLIYHCSTRYVLKNLNYIPNVYAYSFEVIDPVTTANLGMPTECYSRTCHSIERIYLFQAPDIESSILNTSLALGEEMQVFWTNFAKTADPNDPNDETWESYSNNGNQEYLRILSYDDLQMQSIMDTDNDICDLLDNIGAYAYRQTIVAEELETTTTGSPTPAPTDKTGVGDNALTTKPTNVFYIILSVLILIKNI